MWLKQQAKKIESQINTNIQKVLKHGQYIMGPEVFELEKKLAEYVGVKYAIGCSSGTDALLLSLMAYNVKPGDIIFTSSFSFIATAEAISLLGAIPVFIDISPNTFNIDPTKLLEGIVKNHDTSKIKGIIAVDLFGLPANYKLINSIAEKFNLFVIEDAAQSFGAVQFDKRAGSLADIGCTSFFPSKPLGCYGDGGMCFTDDDDLYKKLVSLRVHGQGKNKYDNINIGLNARLDSLQAAILLAKFDIFEEELELKKEKAMNYRFLFIENQDITIPYIFYDNESSWALYTILTKNEEYRKRIQKKLNENLIEVGIYYDKPLHLQTVYKELGYKEGDLKVSEDYSKRVLSLPINPYITIEEQEYIVELIKECR